MEDTRRYENYIAYNWWNHIDSRSINGWLCNFGEYEYVGRLILDNLIFYTEDQMQSYTLNIVNQLKAGLYEKEMRKVGGIYQDDDYFNKKWEEYKRIIRVIPADIEKEAGGSPQLVARKYRSYLGGKTIVKVDNIRTEIENGVKEFIFVDDFSGTGNQISEFLSTLVMINGEEIPIGRIPEYFPDIDVSVAVYVIHKEALGRLSKKFRALNIRYVDLINEHLNLLDNKCIIYQGKSKDEIDEIVNYLSGVRRKIVEEQPSYRKLAEYELNIPVVFEHGCPNNAFLPLYAQTETWKQLFKRGDEYEMPIF